MRRPGTGPSPEISAHNRQAFRPLPSVPASLLSSNDAARVFHDVENYLRKATDEPSRREDRFAWEGWRDDYLGRIHGAAEAAATSGSTS